MTPLPLLALAGLFCRTTLPFLVGMFSHAVIDLLTHQRSAYNHFLPLPLDPFRAPVSYTSLWFTILEHGLLCIFVIWFLKMRSARRSSPRRV